jgi:D-glycero-alpha-D-manno-heptose-7-phosphate kinase
MYELGIGGGAVGGKILGAGGGGFLLFYCQRAYQDQLESAMRNHREIPVMYEPYGSRIIFNDGMQA